MSFGSFAIETFEAQNKRFEPGHNAFGDADNQADLNRLPRKFLHAHIRRAVNRRSLAQERNGNKGGALVYGVIRQIFSHFSRA
jgi:hypothetical protein